MTLFSEESVIKSLQCDDGAAPRNDCKQFYKDTQLCLDVAGRDKESKVHPVRLGFYKPP